MRTSWTEKKSLENHLREETYKENWFTTPENNSDYSGTSWELTNLGSSWQRESWSERGLVVTKRKNVTQFSIVGWRNTLNINYWHNTKHKAVDRHNDQRNTAWNISEKNINSGTNINLRFRSFLAFANLDIYFLMCGWATFSAWDGCNKKKHIFSSSC